MTIASPSEPIDLRFYHENWSDDLDLIRQNRLLDENAFLRFGRDRGVAVAGVAKGDLGDFNKRGWLPCDGQRQDGVLLFHPFRIYPLYLILDACKLNFTPSSSLHRDNMPGLVEWVMKKTKRSLKQIESASHEWNRIADLAILLEPLYWPVITAIQRRPGLIEKEEYTVRLREYRKKALRLVDSLDPDEWRNHHENLRTQTAYMDDNGSLYLFLRLSRWERREKLKGNVSGALWFRHLAEIIRKAFERVHEEQWLEEDQAFGTWSLRGRTLVYGSERPLDDVLHSRPRLGFHFGLLTGSNVRWYVEGDTEYYAILSVLPEPAKEGIELINLYGNIETGRNNAALNLRDGLAQDRALRRFSMITFDRDVSANVKFIQRQIKQDNIVGLIAVHDPDFEFANFALEELIEIAACIDEANGTSADAVREGDWTGVSNARQFEERYVGLSERKLSSLKGKEWGRAMADYAKEHPKRSDADRERPFWSEIRAALQSRVVNYDFQQRRFRFDPETFEQVDRQKEDQE